MTQQPKARVRLIKAKHSLSAQDNKDNQMSGVDGVIERPYPITELQALVEKSTILQQCVDAYKRNIVGFGATADYLEDIKETPEMMKEWDVVKDFIKYFSFDMSFTDLLGELIEDREISGNGYLEIIRDAKGLPVSGARLDPAFMHVTSLSDFVSVTVNVNGRTFTIKKRFRRYVQDVGTAKVYFKEVGDPRTLNAITGQYTTEKLDDSLIANEVLHLKIGAGAYGVPRWIGQLIHMYGSRKAEELNYNYFYNGRHTPMAVLLHNALLSDESEQALQQYMDSVAGSDNAHKFLVIEAEGLTDGQAQDSLKNAKVEVKSLADMLQQDALFLEYDDKSREKVQSAFRLPDIYVGRSKDFNRATADTARTITEEQVFEPERNSLEWAINHKILGDYSLKATKLIFNKPEISNIDDLVKLISVANQVGSVAPNDIREVLGRALGKDLEPFKGEEFNLPKGMAQPKEEAAAPPKEQVYKQQNLLSELKEVRQMLEEQYNGATTAIY